MKIGFYIKNYWNNKFIFKIKRYIINKKNVLYLILILSLEKWEIVQYDNIGILKY